MARIEDIAKKLNISKGTVSKALNGAPDVSETLRKSVLETAVELGYSRSMRKRGAKKLCLFIEPPGNVLGIIVKHNADLILPALRHLKLLRQFPFTGKTFAGRIIPPLDFLLQNLKHLSLRPPPPGSDPIV